MLRIYQNFLSEPQDAIDSTVLAAASELMDAYSNDFTLNDSIRNVDLLGQFEELAGVAGYLNQDGTLYRIFDLTIPLVANDLWSQNG